MSRVELDKSDLDPFTELDYLQNCDRDKRNRSKLKIGLLPLLSTSSSELEKSTSLKTRELSTTVSPAHKHPFKPV